MVRVQPSRPRVRRTFLSANWGWVRFQGTLSTEVLVINRRSSCFGVLIFLLLCAATIRVRPVSGDQWQPVSPEELQMTSVPEAPGAAAVILYRQVDRDDNSLTGHEENYVRIKVLSEEGRKYADVEIPYLHDQGNVIGISGRTVRTDGSIANFDGKAYDKTIVKAK